MLNARISILKNNDQASPETGAVLTRHLTDLHLIETAPVVVVILKKYAAISNLERLPPMSPIEIGG